MTRATATAYYGSGKRLRENSWKGVESDIDRRLAIGELTPELCFLSFADRAFTKEAWEILGKILPRFRSCVTLDLQRCQIKDVDELIALLSILV